VVLDAECGATSTASGGGAELFAEGGGWRAGESVVRHVEVRRRNTRRRWGWNAREQKGKVVVRLVVLVSTA